MDGLSFLRSLPAERSSAVIVVSSLAQSGCSAAMQALEAGAVDVVAKPGGPFSVGDLRNVLPGKIRAAFLAKRPRALRHTCASMYPSTSWNAYRPKRARHCRSLPSARRPEGLRQSVRSYRRCPRRLRRF